MCLFTDSLLLINPFINLISEVCNLWNEIVFNHGQLVISSLVLSIGQKGGTLSPSSGYEVELKSTPSNIKY